jgi:signal transduction histidine kinase
MRVLLVDDDSSVRRLVERELRREFSELEVLHVGEEDELEPGLSSGPFDLVVTDYELGWTTGLKVLRRVRKDDPGCPVIMFTGTGSEEVAVEAMKSGLTDYVLKSAKHLVRLSASARLAIEHRRQQEAAREAERARQRASDELAERNVELTRLARRFEALSARLIDVQEAERRLLARELHDEIGQALTAVKLSLHAADGVEGRASRAAALAEAIAIVDRALGQVRSMSLQLRPSLLDDLGLGAAAQWFVKSQAPKSDLDFEFAADLPPERLPRALETPCFRILQEAVTNVIRHAQARRVWVDLRCLAGRLVLTVRDDGRGFDVAAALEEAARGESLGLLGMQERAQLAGGAMTITPGEGAGTIVRAEFPIGARPGGK